MIKRWVAAAAAMVLVSAAGTASAATISSWVGNANGFGGLVTANGDAQGFDDSFLYVSTSTEAGALVPVAGTGDSYEQGTDLWTEGGLTVQHNYGQVTGIASATVRIFSGGWGLDGLAEVFVNGNRVGTLTDGDDIGDPDFYHFAFQDEFTLVGDALTSLAGGTALVEIRPVDSGDGGVLDYSRLTITTDAGTTTPVPEPTTWALTALALAGLAASRRRQAR